MIEMTSDSEKRKAARCRKSSPTSEEVSSGGSPLKKGPWTSAEDAILLDYVTKHGEGNWNAVQKHSGLSRCGKSCRLRWANHLRPDLKKGAFTPEEENRIIDLHAKMGNKWARMAAELPGRTDNEIKNFWNTRIKRLQRAGLPIYPENVRLQAMNESQQSDDMVSCEHGDMHYSEASETNGIEIPDVEFKNLVLNQEYLNCSPALLDIHPTSLLQSGVSSSNNYGFMFSTLNPHKRLREVESPFCGSVESTSNTFPSFDHHEDDLFGNLAPVHSLWSSSSYDPDLDVNRTSPFDVLGSHAHINGNSSSDPISEAMKLELPSLQCPTSQGDVDTLIQSPLSEHTQSTCPSPRNSGLLDAIVYESQSLKCSNHHSDHQFPDNFVMAGDGLESSSMNLYETKWDAYGDPISPLSHSAASVFVDYTPVSGGSSSDEPQSAETIPGKVDWFSIESDVKKDISCPLQYLRPDAMLDSFWFSHRIGSNQDRSIIGDVGSILCDELSSECKQASAPMPPDESNQGFRLDSSAWDYPESKRN